MQLTPYINFNGDCEEALNFYAKILDGKIDIVNRYDNPAMNAPKEYQDKILHAEFVFSGNKIFASDPMPGKTRERGNGDASLSLAVENSATGQKIFDALSAGGKVHVPFKQQFWGAWHGNFTDKFGIKWMVNCD
jgi:PhnB protein